MTTDQEFSAEERHVLTLAREALVFGVQGRTDRARKVILRINDQHGGDGLELTMQAWADTYITKAGHREGAHVRIVFQDADTGAIGSADDVPVPVAWAGRMLTSRAAMDWETWDALLVALPDDPAVIGQHVLALFQMIALNLRHLRVKL